MREGYREGSENRVGRIRRVVGWERCGKRKLVFFFVFLFFR